MVGCGWLWLVVVVVGWLWLLNTMAEQKMQPRGAFRITMSKLQPKLTEVAFQRSLSNNPSLNDTTHVLSTPHFQIRSALKHNPNTTSSTTSGPKSARADNFFLQTQYPCQRLRVCACPGPKERPNGWKIALQNFWTQLTRLCFQTRTLFSEKVVLPNTTADCMDMHQTQPN